MTATSAFTILEGPVVAQPAPAPQVPIEAIEAMESLTQGGNLIRVWHFDNFTKIWAFFDPRQAFAEANSIRNMVPGQVYWLRVKSFQSVVLNDNPVTLHEGWNLVAW